jgi:Protein of unknown function (DUF1761)
MNFQLILGVSILQIVIAGLWFSPKLFGGVWSKVNGNDGLSNHELKELKKSAIPLYIIQFILQFVTNIIIYIAVANAGFVGAAFGLLVWLGFMMPIIVQNEIWTKSENLMKLKRILIIGGLFLITTVLAGLIFGFFR